MVRVVRPLLNLLTLGSLLLCTVYTRPLPTDECDNVDEDEAKAQLAQYGYAGSPTGDRTQARRRLGDAVPFRTSLQAYQTRYGLQPTGVLDRATRCRMASSRCSVPDITGPVSDPNSPFGEFSAGSRWPASKVQDLTWNVRPNYYDTADVSEADTDEVMARALQKWQDVARICFTHAKGGSFSAGSPDIDIIFVSGNHNNDVPHYTDNNVFDGPSRTLAHAYFPGPGTFAGYGDAHFDKDETWKKIASDPGSVSAVALDWVALHEFGHSLGLRHTDVRSAVMYPYYPRNINSDPQLQSDDILGIQSLYGEPEPGFCSTATTTTTTPTTTTTTPTTTTTTPTTTTTTPTTTTTTPTTTTTTPTTTTTTPTTTTTTPTTTTTTPTTTTTTPTTTTTTPTTTTTTPTTTTTTPTTTTTTPTTTTTTPTTTTTTPTTTTTTPTTTTTTPTTTTITPTTTTTTPTTTTTTPTTTTTTQTTTTTIPTTTTTRTTTTTTTPDVDCGVNAVFDSRIGKTFVVVDDELREYNNDFGNLIDTYSLSAVMPEVNEGVVAAMDDTHVYNGARFVFIMSSSSVWVYRMRSGRPIHQTFQHRTHYTINQAFRTNFVADSAFIDNCRIKLGRRTRTKKCVFIISGNTFYQFQYTRSRWYDQNRLFIPVVYGVRTSTPQAMLLSRINTWLRYKVFPTSILPSVLHAVAQLDDVFIFFYGQEQYIKMTKGKHGLVHSTGSNTDILKCGDSASASESSESQEGASVNNNNNNNNNRNFGAADSPTTGTGGGGEVRRSGTEVLGLDLAPPA